MTQSRASANASSERRRSSAESEAWDRKVVMPFAAQQLAEFLDAAGVTRRRPAASRRGAGRRSRWRRSRATRRSPARCRRVGRRRGHRRPARGAPTTGRPAGCPPEPCSQASSAGRVADRGGQPDPLDGPADEVGEAFQYGQQVPAPVVAGERVHFVDHDGLQPGEEPGMVDVDADQHRLERFRSGEQDVGALAQDTAPRDRCRRARARPAGPASRRRSPAGGAGC